MAESKAHDAIAPVDEPLPPSYSEGRPSDTSMNTLIRNAKAATEKEQNMTLLQGIKLYPKAVAWSVLISTCIAMEGYDISLVNNFYGFPQFNKKYGTQLADGSYEVPAQVRFW
jgi:SP family general alpha glucoside:H+ symporter-like MFS transporter